MSKELLALKIVNSMLILGTNVIKNAQKFNQKIEQVQEEGRDLTDEEYQEFLDEADRQEARVRMILKKYKGD